MVTLDMSNVDLPLIKPIAALACVSEVYGKDESAFMDMLNSFAAQQGMRVFTRGWTKTWEYPWLWLHGLSQVDWRGCKLVDVGSEISPMPWFLAKLGARVSVVEADAEWVVNWADWKSKLSVDVNWFLTDSEILPLKDGCADVVTSFSVIEHQIEKSVAINEVARVLRPDGIFAISFDICEPEMGMTFPDGLGRALTMSEFEELVWHHPAFNSQLDLLWNVADIPAFLDYTGDNYVAGAAILRKRG